MKRKVEEDLEFPKESPYKKASVEKEPKRSSNASLYRPPTSEEMNSLKETENLFKSSLIRMQITELLNEVKPKKKKNKALDRVLHELNTFLQSLPKGKEHELYDVSWLSKKVKFPLPSPPSKMKGKFQFVKPSSVNVVGSYVLGTLTKPDFCVDVVMEMPKECFQAKDYLNMRYHYKRAIYLTVVASKLIKSKTFESVKFIYFNGDTLKPILILKPKGKAGNNYTIKLYPTIPKDFFKEHRFSPSVNNIRQNWFNGEGHSTEEQDVGPGTPHYNSSILADLLMESHLHHLYKAIEDCPAMQDAVVLINVWLQQRELSKGRGSFSSFLAAMVVSHLSTSRKVNAHMSSYQILRVFLQFIVNTDWTDRGIEMKKDSVIGLFPSLSDFHSAYDVVFIDPSGYLNLCASMSKDMYLRVKHEAKLAMEFLDSRFLDGFEELFMRKVPFLQAFDQFFCLSQVPSGPDFITKPELRNKVLGRGGDWTPVVSDWMIDILRDGLGTRIEMLCVKQQPVKEWSTEESPPSLTCDGMMVGLMLNPDHYDSVLDAGPAADDPKAGEFRAFWGDKSELRRFQDGTILEAVVWPCSNAAEKRLICSQVVKHLLQRHCTIEPTSVHFISNQLDSLLQPCTPDDHAHPKGCYVRGTGEEEAQQVMKMYDGLCKQIRSLELPLAVHSLQGISPVFRGSEVHSPTPCFRKASKQDNENKENGLGSHANICLPNPEKPSPWCPVAEVLLQFETSGKWPDDLVAIQHIKAAFHIKLATLLRENCSLEAVATPKYVDVMKHGFAFRVKITHYREMVLLQQASPTEDLDEKEIKQSLEEMERDIVHLPVLTTTLHSIEQQFSAYSGTVRLSKRWVSAHMLSDEIPSECIELLVAYLFITPAPYKPPRTSLVGFLRFLHLMSTCDWHRNPIIVNLNNGLTVDDYQEISTKFSKGRQQLPALFIATPNDKFDSKWTRHGPSQQILLRLGILAKESHSLLLNQLNNICAQDIDFKQAFRPPISDYNVIIWLHHHCLPRYNQSIDAVKASKAKHKLHRDVGIPVLNFDPAQHYMKELKEAFSDIAMFFHDPMGGAFIAVVWKPSAYEKTQFKVLNAKYKIPATAKSKKGKGDQNLVTPNLAAIMEDFEILGRGLVKKVEVVEKTSVKEC